MRKLVFGDASGSVSTRDSELPNISHNGCYQVDLKVSDLDKQILTCNQLQGCIQISYIFIVWHQIQCNNCDTVDSRIGWGKRIRVRRPVKNARLKSPHTDVAMPVAA
jgi:hypothetical protein